MAVRLTPLSDDLRMRNKSCNVIGPMKIKLKDRFSLLELAGTGRWKSTVFYPPPAFASSDAKNLFDDLGYYTLLTKRVEHLINVQNR